MPDTTASNTDRTSSWMVPITGVVIGLAYLVIGIAKDDVAGGVIGLLIMLAYCAGLLLFRRRTEAVALLSADATDERQAQILVRALAATGQVLILLVVGGVFWSMIADNQYTGVFTALAAAGGATFIASIVWFSRRG